MENWSIAPGKVMVRLLDENDRDENGIIKPGPRKKSNFGIVEKVGPIASWEKQYGIIPIEVGMRIMVPKIGGQSFNKDLSVYSKEDILVYNIT